MRAKPIIDMLAVLPDFAAGFTLAGAVRCLGWEHRGENGLQGRHYFVRGEPRSHHLHAWPVGHPAISEHLRFRDLLRGDTDLAAEYQALKQRSAAAYPDDSQAYTGAKAPFIRRVLAQG